MPTVIQNPGMKDSFDDVGKLLGYIGALEQKRRQRTATEKIVMALASGDDNAMKLAMQEAVQAKPEYSGGISGLMQRLGGRFMPGDPGMGAIQETAPLIQQQRSAKAAADDRAMKEREFGLREKGMQQSAAESEADRALRQRQMQGNALIDQQRADAYARSNTIRGIEALQTEQKRIVGSYEYANPNKGQELANRDPVYMKNQKALDAMLQQLTPSVPAASPWGHDLGATPAPASNPLDTYRQNLSGSDREEFEQWVTKYGQDAVLKAIERASSRKAGTSNATTKP